MAPLAGFNEVFKSLSDPTRRAIMLMLRDGDLPAGEIAAKFDMTWPTISHHLNVLKEADLVQAERQGQNVVYSLNATVVQDTLAELMRWFGER
jgi:ArsR family transcriptional regulator, arsenate/arsenite/antimonite-responsive transcriptional repressor